MSKYIDADALVRRLKHSPLFLGTNMQFKDGVIDLVEKQPTADVVEVVRCKDCIHSSYYGKICHYSVGRDVSPDHYCSYAKRSENGT